MKYIYTLAHPITNEVRYVGQTTNPVERLKNHLRKSYRPKQHCQCWIKGLLLESLKPKLNIVLEVEDSEWEYYERAVIKLYSNLTNRTEGGQSVWWNNLTDEERQKFRNKMKVVNNMSNRLTPEGRQRMREAAIRTHTGRKCTKQHKQLMSEKMKGENNHRFGVEVSEETRLKLSQAGKGRKMPDKVKQKLLQVNELRKKKIEKYTADGVLIETYESISEAVAKTGLQNANIIACCKGRLKKTGGFVWRYSKTLDKD